MKLASFSIKRPVAILMMMMIIVVLGAVSVLDLPMDLLPSINPPIAAIVTVFPGASAQEMAKLVTEPLEAASATTPGVKDITSTSSESLSVVVVSFGWGTNMNESREELRTRIDRATLPDGVQKPYLTKYDPSSFPVLQVAVSQGDDLSAITKMVEEKIKPRLERVDGVAQVNITGGANQEIRVDLDQAKLVKYNLTQAQVAQIIQASNLNFPLGSVRSDSQKLNVRVAAKLTSLDDLKNLVVTMAPDEQALQAMAAAAAKAGAAGAAKPAGGAAASLPAGATLPTGASMANIPLKPVRLTDVGTVTQTFAETTSITRSEGHTTVGLAIQKEGSANTVSVVDAVRAELDKLQSENKDLQITTVMDSAAMIKESVFDLARDLIIGGILSVAILWIFLKSFRSTLIIAISIPFSVIATFVLIYFNAYTLNIMTLGGLALAVGLIVDDSIVVIEAIHRHLHKGKSPAQAARDGTGEVAVAVIASTLTTVAVFAPVVFMGGIAGELFKQLAATIAFALLASLVISMTVVPMVASRVLRRPHGEPEPEPQAPQPGQTMAPRGFYGKVLNWALHHRLVTLLIALALMGGSAFLVPQIGTEFLPNIDEGKFAITVKMPTGSDLTTTDKTVADIEKILGETQHVKSFSASIGAGGNTMVSTGGNASLATITVTLDDAKDRPATTDVIDEIRKQVATKQNSAVVTFNLINSMSSSGGDLGTGIQLNLSAPERNLLDDNLPAIMDAIKSVEGVTSAENNLDAKKPEVQVKVNRDKAIQYGLTPGQVAMTVANALKGQNVSRFETDTASYDIMVGLQKADRETQAKLQEILIKSPLGNNVALKDIGEVSVADGPVSVTRTGQKISAQITVLFENRDMGSVTNEITDKLDGLNLPSDMKVSMGGNAQMMQEGFSGLGKALALAIALVYMIMAAEFESLIHPFTILFSLPLAIVGVVVGLFVTGSSFGITAYIGLIMLVGIVVKNGIVLIDYVQQLKEKGWSTVDALIEGGRIRIRPILMTALAAGLGLVPLALGLGSGAKMQQPLAVAVIGGLTTSTLLTLVIVPVIYSLFDQVGRKRRRPVVAAEAEAEVEVAVTAEAAAAVEPVEAQAAKAPAHGEHAGAPVPEPMTVAELESLRSLMGKALRQLARAVEHKEH